MAIRIGDDGVSRRALLKGGMGLAGVLVLPVGGLESALADEAPVGTYPAGVAGS